MSSSEEEDLSKFNEAADTKLFNNSLYSNNKDAANSSCITSAKTSLRHLDVPQENRTDLRVTPGFQKHVATKLMKILDNSLDTDLSTVETKRCHESKRDRNGDRNGDRSRSEAESSQEKATGGIRLFGASAAFLASCNITPPPPSKRRKRGRATFIPSESEDDSSNNDADNSNLSNGDSPSKAKVAGKSDEAELSERFAACAVSSEWILNGEAIKGWAPPFKNKTALEGECTPEVWDFVANSSKRQRKKSKKRRKNAEEPVTIDMVIKKTENLTLVKKKRGKRGKKSKEKKEESAQTHKSLVQELSEFPKKKKKKKKHSKHSKLEYGSADENVDALQCLKKLKKEKRCKKEQKDALHWNSKDGEFGSDQIKSGRKKNEFKQELLLLTWLKQEVQTKKTKKPVEKKKRSTLEMLSEDLENLSTSDVKQD